MPPLFQETVRVSTQLRSFAASDAPAIPVALAGTPTGFAPWTPSVLGERKDSVVTLEPVCAEVRFASEGVRSVTSAEGASDDVSWRPVALERYATSVVDSLRGREGNVRGRAGGGPSKSVAAPWKPSSLGQFVSQSAQEPPVETRTSADRGTDPADASLGNSNVPIVQKEESATSGESEQLTLSTMSARLSNSLTGKLMNGTFGLSAAFPPTNSTHPVCLVARSRAFGEAVEKKARVAVPLKFGPPDANKGVLQRDRLAEWMELAVQHAPPSRICRSGRVSASGFQDAYIRAVRSHLTEASLTFSSRCNSTTKVDAQEDEPCLEIVVISVHFSAEGMLVCGKMADACFERGRHAFAASLDLQSGSPVRLLVHRRHPAMQQQTLLGQPPQHDHRHQHRSCNAWVPQPGALIEARTLIVVASSTAPAVEPRARHRQGQWSVSSRGPLLLPLKVIQIA
eukprot:TRINITY_DN38331_c0_g1_i1.p1 TRINITY_DN38331_c0_g1~~TRINITY_DN38331_c0_g1_i1.p1  ORF type:complete len:467 (+),score=36.16 TRINITY_DN38331_c0_g1_i1:37-1401(+)